MNQQPTTSIEDRDLIRRLLLRQEPAWLEFVQKFERLVWSQVSRTANRMNIPVSKAEIEDICALVFASLLKSNMRSLRSFNGKSRLSTWLTVVSRRIGMRELGKKTRQLARESLQQDSVPAQEPDALSRMVQVEDRKRLHSTLESLGNEDKEILELFYDQNMGYKEISATLGISVNTVGPKLTRAHNRLRNRMRWS
ncbi:MAG: sigma-70 family RNA polymerase sigma factor [Planctomycetota bacterium]|nr:sigma-70 family RNA polymerase sigma factor [Planctomycetota bacterium]